MKSIEKPATKIKKTNAHLNFDLKWVNVTLLLHFFENHPYLEQKNSSNSHSNSWLQFVKSLLSDLGFSHVWKNQSKINVASLLFSVKNKLKEISISFWKKKKKKRLSSETCEKGMTKLRTYKLIKRNFGIETYLEQLSSVFVLFESVLIDLE